MDHNLYQKRLLKPQIKACGFNCNRVWTIVFELQDRKNEPEQWLDRVSPPAMFQRSCSHISGFMCYQPVYLCQEKVKTFTCN